MKIYGSPISPFVRMALVVGHEAGVGGRIEHVVERVHLTTANPKITALSPLGKIPVLETDHSHPLYDSRVIIEYLCHVAGNSTLIPDDGVKRFKVLTLLALGQGLGDAAVGYRYETAERPAELRWPDWIARTTTRITAALDDLEANWQAALADISAGSIAVGVVLSYLDYRLDALDWRKGRPKLAAFHAAFAKRDSMVKTALAPA